MRRRLEDSRDRDDLKRGVGGLADLEFLAQYLLLAHAADQSDLIRPNLWEALDALHRARIISSEDHADLREAYDFLRTVEGRLRLIHNRATAELPENSADLLGLARQLKYEATDPEVAVGAFRADAADHTSKTRAIFERLVGPTVKSS
jgi:glutamate-ammonia-ligase adenylyltransferase